MIKIHLICVNSDPHPGNILLRHDPTQPSKPQIVLIDHGLYVSCEPSFTHDYAVIWKSLFTQESGIVEDITKRWGIRDMEMFASGTLQRPWNVSKTVHLESKGSLAEMYEYQLQAKERARKYLSDTVCCYAYYDYVLRILSFSRIVFLKS